MKSITIAFIVAEQVPAWYHETIRLVQQKSFVQKVYFIIVPDQRKLATNRGYRLFQNLENKWFKPEHDAQETMPVNADENNVWGNWLDSNTLKADADLIQKLASLSIDVLYTIRQDIVNENISRTATFGLWQLRFDNDNYAQSFAPAFWEVMRNEPQTGSALIIKKEEFFYKVYDGSTTTVPYSVKNNFNSVAWKSSTFFSYRLDELFELGQEFFFSKYFSFHYSIKNNHATLPTNRKLFFLFIKNLMRYAQYKIKLLTQKNRFTILYAFQPFDIDNLKKISFKPIPLKNSEFIADPFLITKQERHFVFYEAFDAQKNRGHIEVIELDIKGNISSPVKVLEQAYHLSYPFVFEWKGHFYMIPETASNRTVELYRAAHFPTDWEKVMNLMADIALIDVTLLRKENGWWLFANTAGPYHTSTNDQLLLFYSENLLSTDWTPHPQNPVATQANNCRPAGRIFNQKGKWYRPAQNNASQQYGYGLVINEIVELTETTYKEKEVARINPEDWHLKACHTLNFSSSLIVIDGIL